MSKFLGRLASIGFAKEGTRGTEESAADFFIPAMNIDASDVPEKIVDESSIGVLANAIDDTISVNKAEISLESKVGEDTFGHFLLALLGAVSSSSNADGTYTHTFTLAENSQHPSYTVFKYDPVQSYKYALGMLSRFELNAQLGSFLTATMSFVAKSGSEASITPAYSSEGVFLPQHLTVKLADTQSGLTAATGICVRKMNIQVDKGIITDQCLGNVEYNDILNGVIKISGSMQVAYAAKTYRDLLVNDTVKALRLQAVNGGKIIGSGSQNPTTTLDLYRVKVQSAPIVYENANLAVQNIEFAGYYSVADSAMVRAQLINTVSAY